MAFYIYGSENPRVKSKAHITGEDGVPLCGVKIIWGEVTAEITGFNNKIPSTKIFGRKSSPSCPILNWDQVKCKTCTKKFEQLMLNEHQRKYIEQIPTQQES